MSNVTISEVWSTIEPNGALGYITLGFIVIEILTWAWPCATR